MRLPGRLARATTVPACALYIGLSALTAGAQSFLPPEPEGGVGRINVGPLNLTPAVLFSAGHDSNPNREVGGTASWETYVYPQLEGWLRAGNASIAAYGASEFVSYSEMKGGTNWQVAGQALWTGDRFQPFISYMLRNTNANPTGFEVGYKSRHIDGDLRAGIKVAFTPRLGVSGNVRRATTGWDADAMYQTSVLRQTLNRRSYGASLGLVWEATPLTTMRVEVDRGRDDFTYSPIRDSRATTVQGSVSFSSPAIIQGGASAGYRHFTAPQSGAREFKGFLGSLALGHASLGGGYFGARLSRDLQFSYDVTLAYYLANTIGVTMIQPVAPAWDAQGFYTTTKMDYKQAGSGLTGPLTRVHEFGFATRRRIGRWSAVGVSAERVHARGWNGWQAFRLVCFMTHGATSFRRMDRPIPFQR